VWVNACCAGRSQHQTGIITRLRCNVQGRFLYTPPTAYHTQDLVVYNLSHATSTTPRLDVSNRQHSCSKAYAALIKNNQCNVSTMQSWDSCSFISRAEMDRNLRIDCAHPVAGFSAVPLLGKPHVRSVHPESVDFGFVVASRTSFSTLAILAFAMFNTRPILDGPLPAVSISRLLCIWATWVSVATSLPQACMHPTTAFHTVSQIISSS
jgi:hypothetical protein